LLRLAVSKFSSTIYIRWNWTRWEKEIDWMALNGVNLPLAFTGQEYVWQQVFRGFNLTDEEISQYFSGRWRFRWLCHPFIVFGHRPSVC